MPMQTPTATVPAGFPCGQTFLLPGPAGALEVMAACPADDKAIAATAIVCHPHPLQGGTMHNKVVHMLARSLGEIGLRTVRFNFRGVGASAGEFDRGEGETEDALAVLSWVRAQRPRDQIWLVGFSFGSYVAARTALRVKVAQLVTVAPAVHLYDFATMHHPGVPWLVIQGDADEVVAAADVAAWAERLRPPPKLVMLAGASHFFHGRLHDLRNIIHTELAAQVPPG